MFAAHLEHSEGRNVAGAAVMAEQIEISAIAQEARIGGPPTHTFTALRSHCRGLHRFLQFHGNGHDIEERQESWTM